MASMRFTAGRLLCGKVRDYLKGCKFRGMDIDFMESSGWVERDFLIKGSDEAIFEVRASLMRWVRENGLDT
jgi:hypothetical protein